MFQKASNADGHNFFRLSFSCFKILSKQKKGIMFGQVIQING